MNRFAGKILATFVFICGCGWFVALAGGARWGTLEAGFIAAGTIAIAMVLSPMAAMVVSD